MPTVIKERYELLEALGEGGEGRVLKALDRQHGRFVALKIRRIADAEVREELLSEARILLAVPPHPALPLVREDFFDGDKYVVAMDWVDGTDLATLLRDRGHPGLAPSSVLGYLSQAAEALTHLHAQDPPVIHGDIKPGNLILTKGGRVKLVDFGMSSAPNALPRHAGTPGFRAPELASTGMPSRASDIYALSATAFALLTGSAPAGGVPSWVGIDPAQAEQLASAIRLGMATDPSRRPTTPGELVERLRAGWADALPSGVITFCLSDIEGSTAMWDSEPAAMAEALVRHDELIAECAETHGGRFLKEMGEGDSTVSVFDSASDALAAALAATRVLSAEPWPGSLHIAARFGIHTGAADHRSGDYRGPAVNLAARLRGQADGGQIFLSSVTAELVAERLPVGCSLVDLGPHRLRGVGAPERIHALKGPGLTAPLAITESPYRGLLAFEPEDRDYFFGREVVVRELLARLTPGGLVAVVGASGSGKSSLLRAGVIAAVRAGEVAGIERACLLTPGSSPQLDVGDDTAQLVVVDQFEELFTLCDDAARREAFIDDLMSRLGPVLIGVRADMYGRLAGHSSLARSVARDQVLLGAMTDAELERAVKEPARLAGLRLEPGLVELALRDVAGEPGALPLLSHALRATWARRDGRTLTVEGYRESGGVASAIAQSADNVVGSLPPEGRQMARGVFLRLTALGEGVAETRRRVTIDELVPQGVSPQVVGSLLERLAQERLVTLGEGTVEVAHEVLIREWPTLRGWLEEDREGIRLHRQFGAAAHVWETAGRDASDLYRGARLAAAADWAELHRDDLNATERSFVDASLEEADRERRAQLRANHRLRGLLAGVVALLMVAVVAGVVALIQRSHARAQALTSDAERVGAQALVVPDLDRAMLYAVLGVKLENNLETRGDLLTLLQKNFAAIRVIRPSHDQITALAVNPRANLLATGDSAGVVRFESMSSWQQSGPPLQLGGAIGPQAMTFSPRGNSLAVVTTRTASSDLYSVDLASRRAHLLGSWSGLVPAPPIQGVSLAYDPSGRRIAVAVSTAIPGGGPPLPKSLTLLDASTGRRIWQRAYPAGPGQQKARVAFAPDGTLLTSTQQGDTLLWNSRRGRVVRRFAVGGEPALSGDGSTLALALNTPNPANPSSRIAVLDMRTGRYRVFPAGVPSSWIKSLAFTPDGSRLVGGDFVGNVFVWDIATGAIIEQFPGPAANGTGATTLDPTGHTVLTGAEDGSVTVLDLAGQRRLGQMFQWNSPAQSCGAPPCLVVNREGDLMATDQADGSVAVINLRTLRPAATLPARDGPIANAIAFFPNGRELLTGGVNGRLTVWNVRSSRVVRTIRVGQPVWWDAVSRDGRLIAAQTQAQGSSFSQVQIRALTGNQPRWTHVVQDGTGGLYFSPDGREVAALGCCTPESTVVSWASRSGRQLFSRRLASDATAVAYSPDSRLLAVGTENGQVLFWDPRTGIAKTPPLHVASGTVEQIAFSPNRKLFAVSSSDLTTTLWSLRSRTELGSSFPRGPASATPIETFEPNGRLLIDYLSNADAWPTDPHAWERFACQVAGRNLTQVEWHDIVPNRPYMRVCPS